MLLRILFALLIGGIASGSAWAKTVVDSTWATGAVSIDASAVEWQGSMTFLPGPAAAQPYSIEWSSGDIELRIDTPHIDREAMRSKGGMRGGMGGDRPQMPEPLHLRARIRVASAPSADEPTNADDSTAQSQVNPRQRATDRFETTAPAIGEQLPDLTVYDADGKELRLGELLQEHFTVIVLGCLT